MCEWLSQQVSHFTCTGWPGHPVMGSVGENYKTSQPLQAKVNSLYCMGHWLCAEFHLALIIDQIVPLSEIVYCDNQIACSVCVLISIFQGCCNVWH